MDYIRPVEALIPGVRGRVLSVLAGTTAELSLRTVARLAGVSVAQVSRVMPDLVELGIIERREVPPSSLFRLDPKNVAAQFVTQLANSRHEVLRQLGGIVATLSVPPVSVIVFGSFARGEADRESDLDAAFVRPADVAADDPEWERSIDTWRERAQAIAGNRVELVEVGADEVGARLRGRRPLWRDIARDGVVIFGRSLLELRETADA